jgi:hypothetical protein
MHKVYRSCLSKCLVVEELQRNRPGLDLWVVELAKIVYRHRIPFVNDHFGN